MLLVLVALALGLGVWLAAMKRTAPPVAGGVPNTAAPRESVGVATGPGLDSTAIKSRWVQDISGIDLAGLDPRKQAIFLRFANAERCTCGCGYTLAGCRASDMDCDVSGPHLLALLDSVKTGRIRSADGIRQPPNTDPVTDD